MRPLGRPASLATALAVAAVVAGTAGGCAGTNRPGDRLHVVAGFYPLYFVAVRVGGDRVSVTSLARPGAEPHDLELSPRQVAEIADADLVVYLSGFQPAVDEAVRQEAAGSALDAATVVPLIEPPTDLAGPMGSPAGGAGGASPAGKDPHLWLDPTRLALVADALARRLAAADPAAAADFRGRAADLDRELGQLDRDFAAGLRSCQRREIVVSHAAFGYLAERYDLDQIAITGLSPEIEPTPQRLAAVTAAARRHGATTIFFETPVGPRVAEAIAAEVGAVTAVLDPVEGPPGAGGDYFSVMRTNLSTLRSALGCS